MQQTNYVCGFLFRKNNSEVALITKLKPQWQFGLLNGVGGKVEEGESPEAAMIREFEEETGALVIDWEPFLTMKVNGVEIAFFKSTNGDDVRIESKTAEHVGWYGLDTVNFFKRHPKVRNLQWLIPMALDPAHHFGFSADKSFVDALPAA